MSFQCERINEIKDLAFEYLHDLTVFRNAAADPLGWFPGDSFLILGNNPLCL